MQIFCVGVVYLLIIIPLLYTLIPQLEEKSKIMPIMVDAIYNSATFIKQTSGQDAIVSTWWDRGTFYKTLAEREVHLHSQPHMPTTYWLASFYIAKDEIQAKNIILM